MANPYALGQLAQALTTADEHEDAATRERADARVRAWSRVLDGMRSGALEIGSRTPVRGLPAWATREVVRGGFATGRAVAGGALDDNELGRVRELGLPRSRAALFASYLTDEGLEELGDLLDSGAYEVRVPEDAVLLTVAALARLGQREAALDVLETVRPLTGRLRFMPRKGRPSSLPAGYVHRRTAGEVRGALEKIEPDPRVEAQREAG